MTSNVWESKCLSCGFPALNVCSEEHVVAQPQAKLNGPDQQTPTANDKQVSGSHYKDLPIQPWSAMEAWMSREAFSGFLLGSAIAYLARVNTTGAPGKGGRVDVEKAAHYLQKLLEVMPE